MKLAVSNIAWGAEDFPAFLKLVPRVGFQGVELAASLLWPEPADATPTQRKAIRGQIAESGLETVGLHALLFTRPELTLFENERQREATRLYLKNMFELCRDLGGRTLVFGSPKSRKRGSLPEPEALKIAVDFFGACAEDAGRFGVYLLIEPLSPQETDFIRSSREGAELVRKVAHPNFQLELDGRALAETREDYEVFSNYKDILMHVQTSDPGLAVPGSAGVDHAPIGAALRASGYNRFVSLEMRREPKDPEGAIRQGAEALREHYLGKVKA